MNVADDIKRLSQQETSEAKEDAKHFVETLSDEQPLYARKKDDYMSIEELEALEHGRDIPGNLPDFSRKQVNATVEEIKDALNWAQTLPDL